MATKNLIYGLVDPRNGDVRYIGKSARGLERPQEHTYPSHLKAITHKNNWIKSLLAVGVHPEIVILEENPRYLDMSEKKWISLAREMDWPLTNLTDGGEGTSGRTVRPETRVKIRNALMGHEVSESIRDAVSRANTGRVPSPTTRNKLSLAGRNRVMSQEAREKISAANMGRVPSAEARRKMSLAQTGKTHAYRPASEAVKNALSRFGKKHSDETKAKMSAARKGRVVSEETRTKIRNSLLGHSVSPEIRYKISQTKKAAK